MASDAQGSNPPVALTQTPAKDSQTLAAALLEEASFQLLAYLRAERERYLAQGRGLNEAARALFGRFFSQELLSKVLVVVLSGQRLTNPAADAQTSGLAVINLPDLTHQASATFLDVIVFNDHITDRELFHALVQAAQAQLMGARCYAELFVRGVLQARSYALAPLPAQAFALGARFASHPEVPFSVEDEIRGWLSAGRY